MPKTATPSIHDAAHGRNAMARSNQTAFENKAAKTRARKKIPRGGRKTTKKPG